MKKTDKTELPDSGFSENMPARNPDKATAAVKQANSAENSETDRALLHLVISCWKKKMHGVKSLDVRVIPRTSADHQPGDEQGTFADPVD